MERKNRYVRAARKRQMKLSEWMTATCDNASGLVTANAPSSATGPATPPERKEDVR